MIFFFLNWNCVVLIVCVSPILVLGLIWQIIKIQLMAQITLKSHPELAVLLEEGETMASFMKLPPEQILIRWVNYHMIKAGSSRRIANFSSDIVVCLLFLLLFCSILIIL